MPDCTVVEVIHELGHALGLKHEQQRPDRDKFVTVLTANIEAGETDNFDKLSTADVITTPDCDFQSIMHYKSAAFSANGLPTLLGNNGEPLGNSTSPTLLDAQLVREAYRDHVGVARRSDSGFEAAGAVEHVAVASIFPDRVVTAVRTEAGTLKLIFVDGRPDGGLTRVSDSGDQAGEASDIAIAVGQRIVTALRDGSDDLVLISWDEVLSGPPPRIQRVKDSGDLAGEASLIQILALSPTAFLTACRSASGRLVLISWALNPDGSFTRLDDSGDQAGGVTEISLWPG